MEPKELAITAQQFLSRAQLSGQEVPTYVAVMDWLETFARPVVENPELN